MHVWWAKQEEYADELDALEDAAADAAIEATKGTAAGEIAGDSQVPRIDKEEGDEVAAAM